MKSRIYLIVLLLSLSFVVEAQTKEEIRAERRAARQARQAAELAQTRAQMIQLVKDTTFVLEANTFIGPFGQESAVSSFQNYFAIVKKQVAINIAFNNPNGFGPGPAYGPMGWGRPGWGQGYGPGPRIEGMGPGWHAPGFPGWNWQSWDTPNTPARLVTYDIDMSQADGPYVINGAFQTWTGVLSVPFTIYVQQNGLGRIVLTTYNGNQVTFSGNIVSPVNSATINPIP